MCPLIYGTAVKFEGLEVVIWIPVLIRECVNNVIYMTFNSLYYMLVLIMKFEADKTIINSGKNIQS